MKNRDQEKFFKCSCHGEGMFVMKFHDEPQIYFSYWGQGFYPRRMTLWQRVRFACKVIWTGEAWEDEVILEPEEAEKLALWLNELGMDAKMQKLQQDLNSTIRPIQHEWKYDENQNYE
jgi:hypothetical protein